MRSTERSATSDCAHDGNEQYIEIAGEFERYLHDPYVAPLERDPLHDDVEVLIIGGGFGGLLAGARLREAGIDDIRLVEKGGDFGGTWYWNRYPGAACDVESYVYLPLLEEIGYIPKEKYSQAAEILAHSQAIGRHFDLYRNACFQTEVTEMRWDDDDRSLDRAHEPGRRDARSLHRDGERAAASAEAARHRGHRLVRGSHVPHQSMGLRLHRRRLRRRPRPASPTSASASSARAPPPCSACPHLGAAAKELFVFQRTPSSIDVRDNRPTDPEWAASLEPGWQERRMENFNNLVSGIPEPEDLVDDGWTDIIGNLLIRIQREGADLTPEGLMATMELADFEKMEQIRSRVETIVNDPDTAEALKP